MDWKFSGGTFLGSTSSLLFIVSAGVRDVSVSVCVALVDGSVSVSSVRVGVSADHLHTASTH